MSNVVITDIGINAAIIAGNGGPMVQINSFKLGTNSGFQPEATATDVQGFTYQGIGAQITYTIVSDDSIVYRVTLDEDIGDFPIGNIGLYLASGELFALAALPVQTNKVKTIFPTQIGNRKVFDIMLTLSGLATITDLTILVPNEASLPRVPTQNDLPDALYAPFNVYVVDVHTERGAPTLAVQVGGNWYYTLVSDDPYAGYGAYIYSADLFDVAVVSGNTVRWDAVQGKFVKGDGLDPLKGVLGVRGLGNNIIVVGKYTHPTNVYTPGSRYYGDGGVNEGLLTINQTRYFVGVARTARELLVNVGAAVDESIEFNGAQQTFQGSDFQVTVTQGKVAYWNGVASKFDLCDGNDLTKPAVGVRGPGNTVIKFGKYTHTSAIYTPGALYFASSISPGDVTTTPTRMFIGVAISTTVLLVNPSINWVTVSAAGGGSSVIKGITGNDIALKTLVAGTGVSFTVGSDTITIENVTSGGGTGEVNTASNVGAGAGQVFKQKSGVNFEMRTLLAGAGVTLTNNANDITIAVTTTGFAQTIGATFTGDIIFSNARAQLADGTLANPSLTFAADQNIGMYRYGSDQIGWAINNTLIMRMFDGGTDLHDTILKRPLLQDTAEAAQIIALSGTSQSINLDNASLWDITLSANCTFTFQNPPTSGRGGSFTMFLKQPVGSTWTVTFPASVRWNQDEVPTLSLSQRMDTFVFVTDNGGTTWLGYHVGKAQRYS